MRASACPTGPDRRWAFAQPAPSPPEEGPRATCGQPGLACPWGAAATLREGSREGRARAHAPLSPLFQFGRIADAPAHLQGSNQVVYNVSRPRLWRRGRCGCPPRGAGRTRPACAHLGRSRTAPPGLGALPPKSEGAEQLHLPRGGAVRPTRSGEPRLALGGGASLRSGLWRRRGPALGPAAAQPETLVSHGPAPRP